MNSFKTLRVLCSFNPFASHTDFFFSKILISLLMFPISTIISDIGDRNLPFTK